MLTRLQKSRKKQKISRKKSHEKRWDFIAVSIGEGMDEIFRGLGVDYIIEGGQTMNPSTEDMLTGYR